MYKDLTQKQQVLTSLMSDISEKAWAAGWMDGLEYALWYAVLHGPVKYGWELIDEHTIQQLKDLSTQISCWIIFENKKGEIALSIVEWQKLFEQAHPTEYLHSVDL